MKKNTTGFTIVELLITIVVIAILASISIVAYNGIQARAKDARRAQDMANIKKALLAYDAMHGGVVHVRSVPWYNPHADAGGGWDKSTDAEWLTFLRAGFGNMPVDPVNRLGSGNGDPARSAMGHQVYFYYCYNVGEHATTWTSPTVRLGYHKTNGDRVYVDFSVTSCL